MIRTLFCWLFGHKWDWQLDDHIKVCDRCDAWETLTEEQVQCARDYKFLVGDQWQQGEINEILRKRRLREAVSGINDELRGSAPGTFVEVPPEFSLAELNAEIMRVANVSEVPIGINRIGVKP